MKILKSFTDSGKFVYAGNGMVPHEELSTKSELDFFVNVNSIFQRPVSKF